MMRKFLLLATLALALAVRVNAQVREEVRSVDGEKYIVHQVEPGQTLFGLSRHYAVPLKAITKANPGAADGLSIGEVLLIPKDAQVRRELKHAPELGNGELLHTVAKHETIYGIARSYGVTQESLRRLNPDLQYGLRPGMVLKLDLASSTAAPPKALMPAVMDGSQTHEVMPHETVFGLSKQYGITEEQFKEANGGLPDGLKVGMYVRIPGPAQPVDSMATDTTPVARPSADTRWKIAVLLPFSDAQDTARAGSGDDGTLPSVTEAAVEFHAGMDLALDTLRAMGLNADVHVFDTGTGPSLWGPLLRSDSVRGMDLYIGPFHRAAIAALARVSGTTPIVCPVPQSNRILLGHPTVSKALSSRSDQVRLMARYVAFHHAKDNIILCQGNIFSERELQDQMQHELQEAVRAQPFHLRDSVPLATCERRDVSAAIALLDPARLNVLVVPSEDVEFVNTVVNKFGEQAEKYRIVVYGMNKWLDMRTLDLAAMGKLDVHVPASDFIDHEDPAVNAFVRPYRDRFRNEPGEYAFLGYDVTLFYLSALMQFGGAFPQHLNEVAAKPLHLAFHFAKAGPENGSHNEGAVMLEYKDMAVRPAQ